jgi:allantoin racemase
MSGPKYKIWAQGATDRVHMAPYLARLEPHLRACVDSEFSIDFHTTTPPATTTHAMTEFRIAGAVIRGAVAAEKAGYDCVTVNHFQDAGLAEAKSVVDIPVLGLGETTLLHACMLGRKLGLVTINPTFIPWHEDQVTRYGLSSRVVGVRAVDCTVPEFMHAFATDEGYRSLYPKFEREVNTLIAQGADVIVPAGGLPMMLFGAEHGATMGGAPILNGVTILVKAAEMAVKLRKQAGIGVSRRSNYAKPPAKALDEFLDSLK